jgi:hypothetical protein
MLNIALFVVAVLLIAGYLVYSVAVPVMHYRLGDGDRWIVFAVLLCMIGVNAMVKTVQYVFFPRDESESVYIAFGWIWILYIFVAGSFRRFMNRGVYPEASRALMIVGYTISVLGLLVFLPAWSWLIH